ncbi:MAG: hypothetical protein RLZZ200_2810 [Pseudomonadota bacterium]
MTDVLPRYGLNVGRPSTWGADQLRANVLANPGFEPTTDRALVIVGESGSRSFVDDVAWLARADGFWSGSTYDVRSGAGAGENGRVLSSRRRQPKGPDEFFMDSGAERLETGDVISVTRPVDATPAPLWWKGTSGRVLSSDDTAPGSPGRQAVRLIGSRKEPAELLHYLDTLGGRAGQLLPVSGRWKLVFWTKARAPGAQLALRFSRDRQPALLEQSIEPTTTWQRQEFVFEGRNDASPGPLTLQFKVGGGEVLLDDVYLGEAEPGAGGFRRTVVDTLRALKPGYLRDWQGQLGDTLRNRTQGEFGHGPSRYRPGETEQLWQYGLPDFLELCKAVGARPWIVAPTTLSDDEWRGLGQYLRDASRKWGFDEILVEFGNENWNPLFRAAGILEPGRLGIVTDRGFRLLKAGFGDARGLRTVLSAQFVNEAGVSRTAAGSRETDLLGVAPYFAFKYPTGLPVEQALPAVFAGEGPRLQREAQGLQARGQRLAVYEVNFHTTGGEAPFAERNALVAGAASGAALANQLIWATRAGVREQAVYTLAGFDSFVDGTRELVRLWGITRDLATPHRFRPTGLALQMLNEVAGGRVNAPRCEGPDCASLNAAWYEAGRKLAVVNTSAGTLQVDVRMSCRQGEGFRAALLDGSQPRRTNEDGPVVAVRTQPLRCAGGRLPIALPPWSLLTVAPDSPR